jgi:hypothetical protein
VSRWNYPTMYLRIGKAEPPGPCFEVDRVERMGLEPTTFALRIIDVIAKGIRVSNLAPAGGVGAAGGFSQRV